jgi:hypothetical protein
MVLRRLVAAALLSGACGMAQAGFIFTPHLAEYSRLPRGQYTEGTFIYTAIDEVYDRNGDKQPLGSGAIRGGEEVQASLFLLKYLWIGNVFRDSDVWYLNEHDQFFRVIGTLQHQQATGEATDLSRRFGLRSGNSGFGDLFVLGGIYGDVHRWGPLQWNGLFATTVKIPVGDYDERSLLNPGTNYWTVAPQLALHQNWFGRLFVDGTISRQFNGDNDDPAYGGLVPSDPADVETAEVNFTWKFSERWFADLGVSYRSSTRPNRFENPSVNLADQPTTPDTGCANLGIPPAQCPGALFFLAPQPGVYEDRGTRGVLGTLGFYYIYRTSAVLNARVAVPLSGKGSQFDLPFDVFAPTVAPDGSLVPGAKISEVTSRVNGVQEAAAVSASPYFELRFVYLFWAP